MTAREDRLRLRGPAINVAYLRLWAPVLGVTDLLEQALAEAHERQ